MILAKTLPGLPMGPQQDAADVFPRKMWVSGQERESVLKIESDAHRITASVNYLIKSLY